MILRNNTHNNITTALERSRIVALLDPRQCGKTTLARQFVPPDSAAYFDLEDHLYALNQADICLEVMDGLL
jgi:hypothetical protein